MASNSVIQRNRDRISNLPDNLITHILSFLSTEDAVKTSVLSTSWEQQWTLVPLLRFVDFESHRSSRSFVNFVYMVLLYKKTPLDLFELMGDRDYDAIYVKYWISVALSRHVQQIDVSVYMPTPCCLPDCLYYSQTLVVLKLNGKFVFKVPEKISIGSLKILHYGVDDYDVDDDFEVGESFIRLVPSCPVLEELQIIGRLEDNVKVFNISSFVLKRLILKDLYPENGYELVLNTPNLQYLEHNDKVCVADGYKLNTLHCLDTACFSFCLQNYEFHELIPARSMADLLVATSKVRVLSISANSFGALYHTALPNFELPKFNRLISLELEFIGSDAGLRLLIAFLQSSPQLKSLSFSLNCSFEMTWYSTKDVPFCMIYNLKVIKVDSYDIRDKHKPLLDALTYFLEKTNCLEELIILHSMKKSKEFIEKVSMLPRASNACEIVLI